MKINKAQGIIGIIQSILILIIIIVFSVFVFNIVKNNASNNIPFSEIIILALLGIISTALYITSVVIGIIQITSASNGNSSGIMIAAGITSFFGISIVTSILSFIAYSKDKKNKKSIENKIEE